MNSIAMQSVAAAAKQILGFYDSIPATNQKAFTAGFVEMLSLYPQPVLERAASPSRGLAAHVSYPNLAKFKERLDEWHGEHIDDLKRRGMLRTHRAHNPQRRLPPPIVDEPNLPGRLAQVFVPQGHERYPALVAWSETAETKWWRFGNSSDGRSGIWVPYGVWSSDPTFMSSIGAAAAKIANDVKPSEAAE